MTEQPPIHPNLITAARLPLAPLAVALMITDTGWGYVGAAILAILLELTDIADGQLARRYNVVSDFGKLFDPFSDAFCRFTLFLGLYGVGAAELWMIMLIFYRDSSVAFLRTVAAVRKVVISARPSGKAKAIVQGVGTQIVFVALVVNAFAPSVPYVAEVPWWTMVAITIVTIGSFLDYYLGNLQLLRDAWFDRPVS